jgi:hypothetical protein
VAGLVQGGIRILLLTLSNASGADRESVRVVVQAAFGGVGPNACDMPHVGGGGTNGHFRNLDIQGRVWPLQNQRNKAFYLFLLLALLIALLQQLFFFRL